MVRDRLAARFGPAEKRRRPPLDELVLTILSQSTTDANRDRAWASLRERFPDWEGVHRAPREEVEDTVRVAGLGGQKSRAIKAALARLSGERGALALDHLEELSDPDALEYLTSFDGVGVKTAACVLCFSLRRPVLPVDTHVLRVARRLGWVAPKTGATRAHRELEARVDPDDRFALHLLLIALGRAVCRARDPRCAECPLGEVCPRVGVDEASDG